MRKNDDDDNNNNNKIHTQFINIFNNMGKKHKSGFVRLKSVKWKA
jgi:hypothetical protein